MSGTPLPPALRAAFASDLRPVRPLASPARRALALLAWAPLAAAFVLGSALGALAAGDTAILHAGATRSRHALDGGGNLLVVRIDPAQAD